MKNCNVMVNSLLQRREQYETEKKQKRKMIARTMTPICCACLVAILGVGVWQGGMLEKQPIQTGDDVIYSGTRDTFDQRTGESPNKPKANNRLVINRIDGIPSNKLNIALMADDFVKMNKKEINEYYGIDIFPSVPDDLKEWDEQNFGIYRRNSGSGEVYWDQTVLNYDNENFSRSVNIEIKKGSLPLLDYGFGESSEEKSIINNWEVAIGLSESGYYHAIFMYKNVGFCVSGEGLTQDEFVSVLSSIIR